MRSFGVMNQKNVSSNQFAMAVHESVDLCILLCVVRCWTSVIGRRLEQLTLHFVGLV